MYDKIKNEIKDFIPTILSALVITFLVNIFIAITTVQGASMEPTLYNGNKLLINKIPKITKSIDRGDIIVFDSTPQANKKDKVYYVKRVIGIPGDIIEIKQGNVFVNGNILLEEYADKTNSFTNLTMSVPEDSYFVLGDNRDKSNDSRYFGTILHNQVTGKISMQLYPKINISKFN